METKAKVLKIDGSQGGEQSLSAKVFGAKRKDQLVYDAVIAYMAGGRQGTAKAKNRAEVRGGGRKPFRQKGTGSARQGSTRAPNHVGGGQVFPPENRNYEHDMPKKMRRAALCTALSEKARAEKIFVCEDFGLKEPKTKALNDFITTVGAKTTLLVGNQEELVEKSIRNLPNAKYIEADSLNVFDVLKFETAVFTKKGLESVEGRLGK